MLHFFPFQILEEKAFSNQNKNKNTTTKFLSRFPTKKIGVWAVNSVSHVTVYN